MIILHGGEVNMSCRSQELDAEVDAEVQDLVPNGDCPIGPLDERICSF